MNDKTEKRKELTDRVLLFARNIAEANGKDADARKIIKEHLMYVRSVDIDIILNAMDNAEPIDADLCAELYAVDEELNKMVVNEQ